METFREAPVLGYGTYKYDELTTLDLSLAEMLVLAGLAAIPSDVSGFDLYIESAASAFTWENDGTAATSDHWPLSLGPALRMRNAKYPINNGHYRFFCAGAAVVHIQLWG